MCSFESHGFHCRLATSAHKIVLKSDFLRAEVDAGLNWLIAHGYDPRAYAEPGGYIGRDDTQRFLVFQTPGTFNMQGKVAIAEPEPGLRSKRFEHPHERPGLVPAPPTQLDIVEPAQGVENGVNIGANAQAQVVEVITGIDDDGQSVLRQYSIQSKRELRAADASA
jgi:hypothetical protein